MTEQILSKAGVKVTNNYTSERGALQGTRAQEP
jgi:hypothetical protein